MPRHRNRVTSYPDSSILVRSLDTDSWNEIPLDSIESVTTPDDDGCIEVLYTVTTIYSDGQMLSELRTGESTIDRLFIALGWHSDYGPHGSYTAPLHH